MGTEEKYILTKSFSLKTEQVGVFLAQFKNTRAFSQGKKRKNPTNFKYKVLLNSTKSDLFANYYF